MPPLLNLRWGLCALVANLAYSLILLCDVFAARSRTPPSQLLLATLTRGVHVAAWLAFVTAIVPRVTHLRKVKALILHVYSVDSNATSSSAYVNMSHCFMHVSSTRSVHMSMCTCTYAHMHMHMHMHLYMYRLLAIFEGLVFYLRLPLFAGFAPPWAKSLFELAASNPAISFGRSLCAIAVCAATFLIPNRAVVAANGDVPAGDERLLPRAVARQLVSWGCVAQFCLMHFIFALQQESLEDVVSCTFHFAFIVVLFAAWAICSGVRSPIVPHTSPRIVLLAPSSSPCTCALTHSSSVWYFDVSLCSPPRLSQCVHTGHHRLLDGAHLSDRRSDLLSPVRCSCAIST